MYLTFYRFFGLRENPFDVNPDPDYLFLNQRTQAILDGMASAIEARKGLMVLTGEAGTGKTTLLNRLRNCLQEQKIPTAFIFNPRLEVNELFDLVLANLGISSEAHTKRHALTRLNQWLLDRAQAGTNAVLIVDEAHGLSVQALEEIRLLLNQETPRKKLLQIILSGQPELEGKLQRPDLRHIRQRISLQCRTMPFSLEETHGYIEKRLRIAGATGQTVLLPETIDAVHRYSHGIPRVMNLVCEHALIRAYVARVHPVPVSLVDEVARQLQVDSKPFAERKNPEALVLPWETTFYLPQSGEIHSVATSTQMATPPIGLSLDTRAEGRNRAEETVPEKLSQEVGIRVPVQTLPHIDIDAKKAADANLELNNSSENAIPQLEIDLPAVRATEDIAFEKRPRQQNVRVSFLIRCGVVHKFILSGRQRAADKLRAMANNTSCWTAQIRKKTPILRRGLSDLLCWLREPLTAGKMHRKVNR